MSTRSPLPRQYPFDPTLQAANDRIAALYAAAAGGRVGDPADPARRIAPPAVDGWVDRRIGIPGRRLVATVRNAIGVRVVRLGLAFMTTRGRRSFRHQPGPGAG
jgi:hypothetical protein